MVKEKEKEKEIPKEKKKLPEEILRDSWNGIVRELEILERLFERHRKIYADARGTIPGFHPKDQRILHMQVHRVRWMYFFDEIKRYARTGFDELRLKGGK